jgi:hypothetical protein
MTSERGHSATVILHVNAAAAERSQRVSLVVFLNIGIATMTNAPAMAVITDSSSYDKWLRVRSFEIDIQPDWV